MRYPHAGGPRKNIILVRAFVIHSKGKRDNGRAIAPVCVRNNGNVCAVKELPRASYHVQRPCVLCLHDGVCCDGKNNPQG